MGNFPNRGGGGFRGGYGGGKPSFKNKSYGGDRDRGPVTMHKATCSECGKTCEVPFRPTGEKPVFCNDCFASKREGGDRGGDRGGRQSRDFDRAPKRDFGGDRRPSFGGDFKPAGGDSKKELGEISAKLDRLINLMEKNLNGSKPVTAPAASKKEVVKEEVVVSKKETKKPSLKAIIKKVSASKPATAKKTTKSKK